MYRFNIDRKKKIVSIEFSGYVNDREALRASKEFNALIKDGIHGYSIVSDISQLKSSTRIARILLKKQMKNINMQKPREIIRVIDKYSGAMFFDKAFKISKANYKILRIGCKHKAKELISSAT